MRAHTSILLTNVTLPTGRLADITVKDGVVTHVGSGKTAERIIDCTDYLVLPAAVDLHVHMRGGSQSAKEDWGSGSRSALAGGVTVVVDQPNTVPPLTTLAAFTDRIQDAQVHSLCRFAINSGVTRDTPLAAMWSAGAAAFGETFFAPSSFGDAVDKGYLSEALAEIGRLGGLATIHAEKVTSGNDNDLSCHAALRSCSGEVQAVRDVQSCNTAHARLHFCHLSCRKSVESVTGSVEVTPHHLFLSREMFDPTDTHGKMNPPLRSESERKNLWSVWDRIDVIASDHAPHTLEEKAAPFSAAPSGIPGVETMVPLLMAQVLEKKLRLSEVIEKTSENPARILGINPAGFSHGNRGDFTLYPRVFTKIRGDLLHSRCGWTPFEGMPAVFPSIVIMGGRVVFENGEFYPGPSLWIPGTGFMSR